MEKVVDARDMRYRTRAFSRLGLWMCGAWAFKVYSIHADGACGSGRFSKEILEAAQAQMDRQLAAGEELGDHEGMGYLILHEGEHAIWHVQHWWALGDVVAGFTSAYDAAEARFERCKQPYLHCLWEAVVMEHEQRTWKETMLVARPDRDAYLDRWLPDGRY
jgi:hypothetical protein